MFSIDRNVIGAAELERMTPAEQRAAFKAGINWDLKDAPIALVSRARSWAEERIASEAPQPSE